MINLCARRSFYKQENKLDLSWVCWICWCTLIQLTGTILRGICVVTVWWVWKVSSCFSPVLLFLSILFARIIIPLKLIRGGGEGCNIHKYALWADSIKRVCHILILGAFKGYFYFHWKVSWKLTITCDSNNGHFLEAIH